MLLTELPTFARNVLRLSGAKASAAVATPYVLIALCLFYGGKACDHFILKGYRRSNVRVFCQVVGNVGGGGLMVLAALVAPKSPMLALIFLNLGAVCTAGVGLGVCAIYLELSHEWAGLFYAVSNVFATIPGILVPIATAWLLDHLAQEAAWITTFLIGFVVASTAALVFLRTFAQVDLEPLECLDAPDGRRGFPRS